VVAIAYRRYTARRSTVTSAESLARVVIGLAIVYCVVSASKRFATPPGFAVAAPLLFFAAVPLRDEPQGKRVTRSVLVAMAVLESLIAYPVSGAQIEWSSLLMVPAGLLCLHDGYSQWQLASLSRRRIDRSAIPLIAGGVGLLAGLVWSASTFLSAISASVTKYDAEPALALPGSNSVHVSAYMAHVLESLTRAIRAQCTSFYSLPGLNSFYFFTNERPPTSSLNATAWMYLFDKFQQTQVVRSIEGERSHRFCVVDNQIDLKLWEQGRRLPNTSLVRFVKDFETRHAPGQPYGVYDYLLFVSGNSRAPA